MLPTVDVAHHHAGRTRLRVPARRGDATFFQRVAQAYTERADVAAVETNPLTGSILLHHQAALDDLLRFAVEQQLFAPPPPPPPARSLTLLVSEQLDRLDRFVQHETNETYDLADVAFVGLLAAGAAQFLRGQRLGPTSALLTSAVAVMAYRRRSRHDQRNNR